MSNHVSCSISASSHELTTKRSQNETGTVLVLRQQEKDGFEEFHCGRPVTLGLNLESLPRIIPGRHRVRRKFIGGNLALVSPRLTLPRTRIIFRMTPRATSAGHLSSSATVMGSTGAVPLSPFSCGSKARMLAT